MVNMENKDGELTNVRGKMKSKLILLVFLLFLVLPFVQAAGETLTFQHGQAFDLKRACLNNGTYCSSGAECNLTIIYPDGQDMVNNQGMTFNGSFWNYTISDVQNNQLGVHDTIITCTDGSLSGAEVPFMIVTADGKDFHVFPTQFGVILFGFFLITAGFVNDRLRLFKHVGSMLVIVMGVITLYPGYAFINWTTLMGKGIGMSLVGSGFYFLVEDSFSRKEQQEGYQQKPEQEIEEDGRFHG